MKLLIPFIAVFVLAIASEAQSGPSIKWNVNPAGETVLNYKVYEHVGAIYNLLATVPNPAPPATFATWLTTGLPAGTHTLTVAAVSTALIEGPKASPEVTFPPTAPSGLTVIP